MPARSEKNALLRHAAAGQKGKESFVLKKFSVVPEKAETRGPVTAGYFYFLIVKYSTPPSSLKSSIP